MVIQKRNSYTETKVTFDGEILEQVKQYKYLGLIFCDNTSLNIAQEMLYKKGLKAYYSMSNILYSAKRTNVNNYIMAFDALVKPILMYGCEIWGLESLQDKTPHNLLSGQRIVLMSEKLELKLLKFLLAVPKGTSNVGIRSEFGRLPLRFFALSQILKFYYRMKIGCKNKLLIDFFQAISSVTLNPFSKILTTLVKCNVDIHEPSNLSNIKVNVK